MIEIDLANLLIGWFLAVLGGFIVGLCVGFRLSEKNPPKVEPHAGRNPNPPPAGPPPVSRTRQKVIRHTARNNHWLDS